MILTADDFGYSKKVNHAIIDACRHGAITRVSLLINAGETEHAIWQYKKIENKNCPIGLHFNLTEGHPVSKTSDIPSLVDAQGMFYPIHYFLVRLLFNRIRKEEVRIELYAQILSFQEAGLTLHHIDSHQNIHCFEPLHSIISESVSGVVSKNGLRSIGACKNRLKKFPIKYAVFLIVRYIQSKKHPTNYKDVVRSEGTVEKIIHPGASWD